MNLHSQSEHARLDHIAGDSWYAKGVSVRMVEYSFEVFSRYIAGGRILEMGPAEGVMTPYLARLARKLTIVEGAAAFCESLRIRFPDAEVVHVLFEDYKPLEKFDSIVLGHVLEHVADPVLVLQQAAQWLTQGGRILASVPNARSLHRQAAVIMGLLPVEDALNEMDIHHGHRRVFSPESFRGVFLQAGLEIKCFGGYWIKPLSNKQIEASWAPEMLDAFMQLGERYPDIAAENYIIAGQRAAVG